MEQDYGDCNQRFESIVNQVEEEISKVDNFFKNYTKAGESVSYDLSKAEKKKMIDNISESSRTCKILIEELKMHRTEVKYLLNAFHKLAEKYEKLKLLQQEQLTKIDKISNTMRTDLAPSVDFQSKRSDSGKEKIDARVGENNQLEAAFKKIESKVQKLIKENNEEIEHFDELVKQVKDENCRDKVIFCLVTKYIKKAFEIQAKLKCKDVKLVDYAFVEAEKMGEAQDCCCDFE